MKIDKIEPASYKDSDGYVFYKNGKVYRAVSASFLPKYKALVKANFYEKAISGAYLFPFKTCETAEGVYLESERISPISYPYEWSFEQMKSAALFQLRFLVFCLKYNVMLKDASPFNLQFVEGKLIFIDILSLEPYVDDDPWNGYKQFCESFLSPLLLSHYFPGNWNRELLLDLEGVSLQKTASLLPFKSNFNGLSLFHIKAQAGFKRTTSKTEKINIPKAKTLRIINHLIIGIEGLEAYSKKTNWTDYTYNLPYSEDEKQLKQSIVRRFVGENKYPLLLDVGANNSLYTSGLNHYFDKAVLIDNDSAVIDALYREAQFSNVLPLHVDITNVSPSVGVNLKERKSFFERVNPDLTIALAVIHHLFHARNIPLVRIAELFQLCSPMLVVEFVSETDEMFLKISNPNNKHPYSQEVFEESFSRYFSIEKSEIVKPNKRIIYLMRRR